MRVGIPKETRPGERRIAVTPETVTRLRNRGLDVLVEAGAGAAAGYDDAGYAEAGAQVVDVDVAFAADIVAKITPPTVAEVGKLREGALLIAVLQADSHPDVMDALVARKVTALALERIPRVTRAQKMDVLSSMANLAGYRAVIEAAAAFQGTFGAQVTAAGSAPPTKVLVIGAGVAGLAAISAARALGAEVRAFDTRLAAKEQVESLGATFLELKFDESGEGAGGYAKVMSPEFIAAEMALFKAQAAEVDIVITTALIPGKRAPILLPKDVVEALAPGSVVVDMAAEQGGNCELCVPGQAVVHRGITILGYTDLASRMATVASRFFAVNVANLVDELVTDGNLELDLEDAVVRPALLTHAGERLPPPPPPPAPAPKPAPKTTAPPPPEAKPAQQHIQAPNRRAWGTTFGGMLAMVLLFVLGRFAPEDFLQHSTVFVLACFVGWQVIWSVTPALHTPLMSVTNAISGIIVIGGILRVGDGTDVASWLGAAAVLLATINVTGGFLVTERMLDMFRKGTGGAR